MALHLNHQASCSIRNTERPDTVIDEDRSVSVSFREHEQGEWISFQVTGTVFVGLVLRVFSETVQVMSDVWEQHRRCEVWNPLSQKVERYWVSEGDHAEVDASAEVRDLADAYLDGKHRGEVFRSWEHAHDKRQEEFFRARDTGTPKGREVKVVKGRKVPLGTTGRVFWEGWDNYGKAKVGIATTDRKDEKGRSLDVVWTAASNCLPVNPKDGFVQL